MLKNKIALKRIRNIIFLGLIIITMIGIYNNSIRNSRAEPDSEITVEIVDKKQLLSNEEVIVNKVYNSESQTYTLQLTNLVNGKKVIEYYIYNTETQQWETIEAINGTVVIVPEASVEDNKVQIQTLYDSKEMADGTVLYNKLIVSDYLSINGYMPDKTSAIVGKKDKETGGISNIVLPNENEEVEAVYEIGLIGYQPENYQQTIEITITSVSANNPVVYYQNIDGSITNNIDYNLDGESLKFNAGQFFSTKDPYTYSSTYIIADKENSESSDSTGDAEEIELPVWEKVSSKITENGMDIIVKGTSSNWGSDELTDSKIDVIIDGETATSISATELEAYIAGDETKTEDELADKILVSLSEKTEIEENGQTQGVQYKISLSNLEQTTKQETKIYSEWSGNVGLKIEEGTLKDVDGNVNSETTIEETEKINKQTENKMFIDKIVPEYLDNYTQNIEVERGVETLTVEFGVVDKYFSNSTISTYIETNGVTDEKTGETWATITDSNLIQIKTNNNETLYTTDVIKKIKKVEDITTTTNGVSTKIGEKYKLIISNLEKLQIQDGESYKKYGNSINIVFEAGIVSDYSGNVSEDEIFAIERNTDTTNPIWELVSKNIEAKKLTVTVRGTDENLDKNNSVGLNNDSISVYLNDTVKKDLIETINSNTIEDSNVLEYQVILDLEKLDGYSGKLAIEIGENTLTDTYTNKNEKFKFDIDTIDFEDPKIKYQKNQTVVSEDKKQLIVIFDIYDKYFSEIINNASASEQTVQVSNEEILPDTSLIKVVIDGDSNADNLVTKSITKIKELKEPIDGVENSVVGGQYALTINDLDKLSNDYNSYSGAVSLSFSGGIAIDKYGNKNKGTTISITTTKDEVDEDVIVDFTIPVWELKNYNIDRENKILNISLTGKDKYLKECTLSKINIYKLKIDGTYENLDLNQEIEIGEISDGLVNAQISVNVENISEELYIGIPSDTLEDNSGNMNTSTEKIQVGVVDFIKPVIEKVSSEKNDTDKLQIVIKATDNYYDDSKSSISENDITVYVDGENAENIVKTIKSVETIKDENDLNKTIGQQYTFELTNFQETTKQEGKSYLEWSGNVTIDVAEEKISDISGNLNEKVEQIEVMSIDEITPEFTYKYSETDINQNDKTLTVKFDVIDKYFEKSTLTTENTEKIKIILSDENSVDITNDITKTITDVEDITAVINNETKKIGERYTLVISNLENATGTDYSGFINVVFDTGIASDKTGNISNKKTITIGVDEPDSEQEEGVIVDVVDPVWEKVGSVSSFETQVDGTIKSTATITVKGRDKYLSFTEQNITLLKPEHIKVYVNNIETQVGVSVTENSSNRTGDSVEYAITLTEFSADANQVSIEILPGALKDSYGNTNKLSEKFIALNTLKLTDSEKDASSTFLGISGLSREDITSVEFILDRKGEMQEEDIDVSSMSDGSIWARVDSGSVLIYSANEMNLNSNSSYLFANIDSEIKGFNWLNTSNVTNMSHMFENYVTTAVTTITLGTELNTTNVKDMSYMFAGLGSEKLTNLVLSDNFSTLNASNMSHMFEKCGKKELINFNLGTNFNTNKVTDMSYMFNELGLEKLTNLNLGNNFNTSKVTNMSYMFAGLNNLVDFDFGTNFTTNTVTDMSHMFENCGKKSMTKLDLNAEGIKFDTSNVTDMTSMFQGCGSEMMTELDFGPAFTKIATKHENFITDCGKTIADDLTNSNVIQVPQLIYNDIHNLKLNKDIPRVETIGDTTNYINYQRGTINPKYSPFWEKEDSGSAVTTTSDAITINIVGTDEYEGYNQSHLRAEDISVIIDGIDVDVLTEEQITEIRTQIDNGALIGEELSKAQDSVQNSIHINLSSGTEGKVKAIGTDKETTGIKYTITLTNVEQGRKDNIFKEWSGNIKLKIAEETLEDTYGNFNFENKIEEKSSDGEILLDFDAQEENRMFKDNIAPEITYKYSETTDINQENQTVSVVFDITDKYITDNINLDASKLGILVDEEKIDLSSRLTLTYMNDISEEINGTTKKIGERYKLEIKLLDENLSGPITVTFEDGMVEDKTGNASNGKSMTITIGVDNPDGDPNNQVIVDFVKPVWEYVTSSINRTRNGDSDDEVQLTLRGSDKYIDFYNSKLEKSDIKVFIDGVEATEKVDIDISNTEKIDEFTIENIITLSGFGTEISDYGKVMIKILPGALQDRADEFVSGHSKNYSEEVDFYVGNSTWKETIEGVEQEQYTAFKNSIVDFEKPIIKYQYAVGTNPKIDAENQSLTITFDVLEKYFYEDGLTFKADGTDLEKTELLKNLQILVDGNEIWNESNVNENLVLTSKILEDGTGRRYTLDLSGFEQEHNGNYKDYSGPIQLVFAENIISDTSGNKNDKTTITIDYDNGDDVNNPIIVDVIKPIWEDINQDLDVTITRGADKKGIVDIIFKGTDKYFEESSLTVGAIKVLVDGVETSVTKSLSEETLLDNDSGVQYTLTLSDFGDSSGKIQVVLPGGVLKDKAGLINESKTIDIDLIDFIKPTWTIVTEGTNYSKINRTRDGKLENTVEIKVKGYDKYLDKVNSKLTKSDIIVYDENNNIVNDYLKSVSLVEGTDDRTLEYIITLGNFGDYEGLLKIDLASETLVDTSLNTSELLGQSGVGNLNWLEANEENVSSPEYTAFREDIVDFTNPKIAYKNTTIDYANKKLTVNFTTTDEFFLKSNLEKEDIIIKIDGKDATKQLYADGKSSLTSKNITKGKEYTLVLENFDVKEILEEEQYVNYSGPINLIFAENVIIDKSGNKNTETTMTIDTEKEQKPLIIDVVNPVWNIDNLNIDSTNKNVTVDLIGTDKYFKSNSLTLDKVDVYIDGEKVENISKEFVTLEDGKTEKAVILDGTDSVIGVQKTLKLSGFELTDKLEGKSFKEWSGTVTIIIAADTLEDYTKNDDTENINKSEKTEFNLGYVDFIKPLVEKVSSSTNKTSTTPPTKITYVFTAIDKYFASSKLKKDGDTSDITVYVNGEKADSVSKKITKVEDITSTINDITKKVGEKYTLELTNFTQDERQTEKSYLEWSGNVTIDIAEGIISDEALNSNDAISKMPGEYIDCILPEFTYKYSTTDIDKDNKTLTVVFDITDKYFSNSAISTYINNNGIKDETTGEIWAELIDTSLIKITVDNNENADSAVTKKIQKVEDITGNVNGVSTKIGEKYKLVISNLEQLQIKDGDKYKDYSGPVQISFVAGIAEDNGNEFVDGEEISILKNKSLAKTITIGIDEPGTEQEEVVVDVVDPVWEKVSSSASFNPKTDGTIETSAILTVRATDKYFNNSTLTNENIKDYITVYNGSKNITSNVSMSIKDENKLTENRTIEEKTSEVQYGIEYEIAISNFESDVNQLSVKIAKDVISDISGNKNLETDKIIIFSTLKETDTEKTEDSKFLGMNIQRSVIEGIVFEANIDGAANSENVYDVSAAGDNSIVAWYGSDNIVHIGSVADIYANSNSSYLFAYVGSKATKTFSFENQNLLRTSNVINMSHMYEYCGASTMTYLYLGGEFDTSNVKDMSYMFAGVGFETLTELNLGIRFNTSNVTNMNSMFYKCGYTAMKSLDLGDIFYTEKVTDMDSMFEECGYNSMSILDLGPVFDRIPSETQKFVENCGKNSVNETIIYAAESIWNDEYYFKLNTNIERTAEESLKNSSNYINYTRGKINPKYKLQWSKYSSTVTADDNMEILIQGGSPRNIYLSNTLPDKLNDIKIFIDSEQIEFITENDLSNLSTEEQKEVLKSKVVLSLSDPIDVAGGVQYKITLSNIDQVDRKYKKDSVTEKRKYLEWSGNVKIIIPEGTLKDINGNSNIDDTIKDSSVNKETTDKMFIDSIKPEITYKYSNSNVSQENQTVTVEFDIADKYLSSINLVESNINLIVDNSQVEFSTEDEEGKLKLNLEKIENISETVNGTNKKVGEKYRLAISNFEQLEIEDGDNYVNYSGPITIAFDDGIAVDNSGNSSLKESMTITVGVDEPEGSGSETIVDFVKPVWTYKTSSIERTRNGYSKDKVIVTLQGSDKYLDFENSNLKNDNIKIYIDGNEATEKVKVNVGDPIKISNYIVEYNVTISDFGKDFSDYGKVKMKIDAKTLADRADEFVSGHSKNYSEESEFWVGNSNWVEKIGGTEVPEYKGFNNSVVDFEKPVIKYEYSESNLEINTGSQMVTVVFDVLEKEFYEDNLTFKANGTDITQSELINNLKILVDGENISQYIYENANTSLETEEISNGRRYTFKIAGFEQAHNGKYKDYSGPVQLVFSKDVISDISGNKNEAKTITINKENGENVENSIIVDFIKPRWEYLKNDTNYPTSIYRTRTGAEEDKVEFYIKGSDKYYSNSVEDPNSLIEVYFSGNKAKNITKKVERVAILKEDRTEIDGTISKDAIYGVIYKITLTDLGNYNGRVSIRIPENTMQDATGNYNNSFDFYIENENWIENDDDKTTPKYSAFKTGYVDFIKPVWIKESSSINKESKTVSIDILAQEKYCLTNYLETYNENSFTEENDIIKVYTEDDSYKNIEKSVTYKETAYDKYGNILGKRYILTLSNFGTYEGPVFVELLAGTIVDKSGNKNESTGKISVGNTNWEEDFGGFKNNIVDFEKPKVDLLYNSTINKTNEIVTVQFEIKDKYTYVDKTKLSLDDIEVYVDDKLAYKKEGTNCISVSLKQIATIENTDGTIGGYRYELVLSNFEKAGLLEGYEYLLYSGEIKIKVKEGVIYDTSANYNNETILLLKENESDVSGIIVDFIDPYVYFSTTVDKQQAIATIVVKFTDRFFDDSLGAPSLDTISIKDINGVDLKATYKEQEPVLNRLEHVNANGEVEFCYGYEYIFTITNYEHDEVIEVEIEEGIIKDLSGNTNSGYSDMGVIDFQKPEWIYVSSRTCDKIVEENIATGKEEVVETKDILDENGTIEFVVQAQDLDILRNNTPIYPKMILTGSELRLYCDGIDVTNLHSIEVTDIKYSDVDPAENSIQQTSSARDTITYTILVSGIDLENPGTYTLVFAEGMLEDTNGNRSNGTTMTFSKSMIDSNNYQTVKYYQEEVYDVETRGEYYSYINELYNIDETGTNENGTTYMPSTIYDLHLQENVSLRESIFKEPFSYDPETETQVAGILTGWREMSSDGIVPTSNIYGMNDDIPANVGNLRPVWSLGQVIFVSASNGSSANNGLSPDTPVKTIEEAIQKINDNGDMNTQLIIIMDEVKWGNSTLTKNVTITSYYAGTDYKTQGAVLKITGNISMKANLTFDNIKIDSVSKTVAGKTGVLTDAEYENLLIANYNDLTIGRRVESSNGTYTFGAVIGGNYGIADSTVTGTQNLKVEGGRYNNIIIGSSLESNSTVSSSLYQKVTIGSKKEASKGSNDYLEITGYLTLGQNEKSTATSSRAEINYYGGTFTGENAWELNSSSNVKGAIYLRQPNEDVFGNVIFKMYNGLVKANIYTGDSGTNTNKDTVLTNMNFYGGTVENANIYGLGTQNYIGKSKLYIAGIFSINGDVYGGVNNVENSIITVDSDTNIEIASNSVEICGDVFGGSNGNSNNISSTNIDISGVLKVNNIYAGSNNSNGTQKVANLTFRAGEVLETIYGGSKYTGLVENTNITMSGGTIPTVYGGGDEVKVENVNITTSRDTTNIKDKGAKINVIYAGSNSKKAIVDKAQLNIEGGYIYTIYGGGNGVKVEESSIIINDDKVTIENCYGGPNAYNINDITDELIMESSNITLNHGHINKNLYGGGNYVKVKKSNVTINGGFVWTNVYGGSNKEGQIVEKSDILLNGGFAQTVYGGGNGVEVIEPNITLNGSKVRSLFGGSFNGDTIKESNITIIEGNAVDVYGGGRSTNSEHSTAIVEKPNIWIEGGVVNHLYAGGYEAYITEPINLNVIGAKKISNIYGGSRGNIVLDVPVNINIGKVPVAEALDIDVDSIPDKILKIENIYGAGTFKDLQEVNYNYIASTQDISINIDGTGYNSENFAVLGTVQGAGRGMNYNYGNGNKAIINIKNYGTPEYIQNMTSIQRADEVYIDNSYIELTGIADDTGNVELIETNGLGYTLNRIDNFTFCKTSLYLRKNVNMIKEINSLKEYAKEEAEEDNIDETNSSNTVDTNTTNTSNNTVGDGNTTNTDNTNISNNTVGDGSITNPEDTESKDNKNKFEYVKFENGKVSEGGENRIFVLEDFDLWLANTPLPWNVIDGSVEWTTVNGMMYFGQYLYNRENPGKVFYDIYDPNYSGGAQEDFFERRSVVYAKNKGLDHDLTVDGFYTNLAVYNENNISVTSDYMTAEYWDNQKAYKWSQTTDEPIIEKDREYYGLIAKTYQYDQDNMLDLEIKMQDLVDGSISYYEPGTKFKLSASVMSLIPDI